MLGRADDHGVELAFAFKQPAEIAFLPGPRMDGRRGRETPRRDITQGDDVLGGDPLQVAPAPATGADDREPQPAVEILAAQEGRRGQHGGGATGELAAG